MSSTPPPPVRAAVLLRASLVWDNHGCMPVARPHDTSFLPQLQRYAAASAQVVGSYRLQFSIGQRTLLDVLNAENELFSARSSEYTGAYAVGIGELRLLAAMAREQPTTLEQLAGISGVGARKLEAYGSQILRVLAANE